MNEKAWSSEAIQYTMAISTNVWIVSPWHTSLRLGWGWHGPYYADFPWQ